MSKQDNPTGFEGNLTENQQKCLLELKDRLAKSEYASDVERDPGGDKFLLAFLRATMKDKGGERIFQVDACIARLTSTFKWRKQYGIDEVREAAFSGGSPPDGWASYCKVYPCFDSGMRKRVR